MAGERVVPPRCEHTMWHCRGGGAMTRRSDRHRDPDIVYTKSFLQSAESDAELHEILLWWEMALVRRAKENLKKINQD